jgi:hypothetical protein
MRFARGRDSRRVAAASAVAAAMAACLAGCGGTGRNHPAATGVLPASAIALPAVTRALTAADVQKDSTLHGLAARLSRWGFLGGWQRTFQGESRRLTLVVSRSLRFAHPAGATAFVSFLDRHVDSFYPFAVSKPLTLAGQSGWLIKPPLCACHMAEPLYVGVTAAGRQVRWLEINGPRATGVLLARLLAAQVKLRRPLGIRSGLGRVKGAQLAWR